jgi:hypothetical protein
VEQPPRGRAPRDALLGPSYVERVDFAAIHDLRDLYHQNSTQRQWQQQPPPPPVFEHLCSALEKISSSGSFYYALSPHWDALSRIAERLSCDRGEAVLVMFNDCFV